MQYLSPSVAAMVNSLYLVILLILQYTALKHIKPGHHNWLEILGAVFCLLAVIAGPVWHILKQAKQQKSKDSSHENSSNSSLINNPFAG
jgi:carbon starvation protein CstA